MFTEQRIASLTVEGELSPTLLSQIFGNEYCTRPFIALGKRSPQRLAKKSTQFLGHLALMDEPPPVPPKDRSYSAHMEIDRPLSAPASGSKRKREPHEDPIFDFLNGNREAGGPGEHTPKRSRPSSRQGLAYVSDDAASPQPRNVRRKKGSRNLSNLNLRHAAEQHASNQAHLRPSRFQEGSLTDKPSENPPSWATRVPRTESGKSLMVDELMTDYHEGSSASQEYIRDTVKHETAMIPQRVAEMSAQTAKKDEGKSFFQFGRQLAANFHPVTLWQKLWHETKDELSQQQIEEEERKAKLKADAEAKYAEMKKSGQLGLQPVGRLASGASGSSDEVETPRDSAIVIDSERPSKEHTRDISTALGLFPPQDDITSRSGSEVPETASKQNKTLKSRLHLKRPSLSNIKNDLKRVKSDFNLAASIRHRESSSSLSPVKADFDDSTLRRSQSKFDLKKQHKLSKRVSDLESKLELARRELDNALVEASPMPKLSGRFERFTPSNTLKRPKFVPGKLPSLPSERILMAQENGERDAILRDGERGREPRNAVDLTELFEDDSMNEEDTIKAARARQYPTRASSLFNLDNDNVENTENFSPTKDKSSDKQTSELTQLPSEAIDNMDPNSITNSANDGVNASAKTADYSSLDAKLKALEDNVKIAAKAKAAKSKKRKSKPADDDKIFKPGDESNDDAEWEEATPKKKRKSKGDVNSSSPQTKRSPNAKQSSPRSKKATSAAAKTNGLSSSPVSDKKRGRQATTQEQSEEDSEAEAREEVYSADELDDAEDEPPRTSLDSQVHPLDPVYEEEEESFTVPLNDEPSKPTAKATPARYGRHATRSRSTSPNKRSGLAHPGVEEQLITRAAEAAKNHPARNGGRSASPPPANGYTKTTVITETETVTVIPGEDGVPKLPKGANGSFETLAGLETEPNEMELLRSVKEKESFEWPEDVF